MAKEQASFSELLPLLNSSDLQQLEQVKTTINDLLITDRGGVILSSLVDFYLDTTSPQAALILSSVREPNDKALLDKLNETLSKPGCRVASLTLLGYLVRRQPPWMHKISRSPLLASLLKCLKSDSDVVVLITGVLVLITLLPMITQTGKQHIYDFFDVFGRLASWSLRNPGQVHGVYLVHLHASVYSLFHRLYGMYPCNFISYLRSHYSMKENLDTFQELVKPMLEHVRVHPELVTGTQDYELDPSRWKRYEIHDIVIECAKVSLDPKDSSCEEGYSSLPDPLSSPRPPLLSSYTSLPHLHLTTSPYTELVSSIGSSASTPLSTSHPPPPLSLHQQAGNNCSYIQCQSVEVDVTWSPSSQCGLTTPPTSRGISPANVPEPSLSSSNPPSRTSSISGVKCPSSATTPVAPSPASTLSEEYHHVSLTLDNNKPRQQPKAELEGSVSRPIGEEEREGGRSMSLTELSDFIKKRELEHTTGTKERDDEAITEEIMKLTVSQPLSSSSSIHTPEEALPLRLASTPDRGEPSAGPADPADHALPWSFRPCFTPIQTLLPGGPSRSHHSPYQLEEGGPALFSSSPGQGPVPPYEPLFQLALPRAASLFVGRKTQEVVQRATGEREKAGEGDREVREEEGEEVSSLSPLEVLDRLILHGHEAHDRLSRRLTVPSKSVDWSHFGGKHQSMKTKGSGQGEELQGGQSQVLLLHSQLQYERYKRQLHAMRNRRLLRRVINATALEEHNNSMKAQLKLQDVEIQSLKASLVEEQQRYIHLKQDTHTETARLHAQTQQLQQQHQEYYTKAQKLQSELQECQSRLGDLEAELQKANNEAYNAEHQLTQLSLKLSSSEELQQQMHLLNKQMLLLRETNRLLMEEMERGGLYHSKEMSMLQSSVSREHQRLRDSETQKVQKLEAANHRISELESQLAKKDKLIVDQKKLLEDVKAQSKAQLSACESRYMALRRVSQALQTEMLQLYSQTDLDDHTHPNTQPGDHSTNTQPDDHSTHRPNGKSVAMPTVTQGSLGNKPSASSFINGGLEPLSTSPLHLLSSSPLSLSPIDSPLAVGSYPTEGSFLGQRARQLFRQTGESQEGEGEEEEKEGKEEGEERRKDRSGLRRLSGELAETRAQQGSLSVGQEGEESGGISQPQASASRQPASCPDPTSQTGSSLAGPPAPASLPSAPASLHPAPASLPPAPASLPSAPASLHSAPASLHPAPASLHPAPASLPPAPGPVRGQATAQRGAPHPAPRALAQAVRQRRYELSIMDYDETLPEY